MTNECPKPKSKSLTRYLYTFKDSPKWPNGAPMSGEKITFEDSPITLFLHPNNQYWIKRNDGLLINALGKARQVCHERQWPFLRDIATSLQTYVQETARKSSPVLPHLHFGKISTFDIGVSMDNDGNYIHLEGKKDTPYERLGLTHLVLKK